MVNKYNNKAFNRKQYIKRTKSREVLRTYTPNKDVQTVYPDFSLDTAVSLIDNDPVARGALNHFVDKCMEGGYSLIKKDTQKYDREFELALEDNYQFRTDVLRKIFLMGKLFNNVYVEIIRDVEGKTKKINVLDSTNIEPITAPNGDPIRYKTRIPNPATGEYPTWEDKDIVWIKFGDRSRGYAPLDLKALYTTLLAKQYVRDYVSWLWKTGQYRVLYNFKSASEQNVLDFLAFSNKHDNNYQMPFIAKGEMETKILRDMKEVDSIDILLKYYDNQIAILFRVPPNDLGIPDSSGRSNADAQSNNFATHVISWKKVVEDKINFELFKKINKGNNLLKFAPLDRFAEKSVFEIIQIMKASGFTNEACEEYLKDKGMLWASKMFNDPMEMMEQGAPANPKEKDNFVSRQRDDSSAPSVKGGSVSTRQEQIQKQ